MKRPPRRQRAAARLSHVDERGRARMVDVGAKPETVREAVAEGEVRMSAAAAPRDPHARRQEGRSAADRAAGRHHGRQAHGRDHSALSSAAADARRRGHRGRTARRIASARACGTVGRTGVEMEALVAVAAAALTLYDMLKAVDGDGHRPDAPARKTRRPQRRLPPPLTLPSDARRRRDSRSARLDDSACASRPARAADARRHDHGRARSRTRAARAFADADVAFATRMSADEFAIARHLKWMHSSAVGDRPDSVPGPRREPGGRVELARRAQPGDRRARDRARPRAAAPACIRP